MDDRRDDEPREDEAVFRVARVGPGRGSRSTVAALALTLTTGALVVAGTIDGPAEPIRAPIAPAATSMADIAAGRAVPEQATATSRPAAPVLVLHTRAWGRYLFVHGDVFALDAEVVIVSIFDANDDAIDIRSIDMPKGSTALRLGASDRFQIAFQVVGLAASEIALVQANAYDRFGRTIASERQLLDPRSDPGRWRSEVDA